MEMVKLERTVDGVRQECLCEPQDVEKMTNPFHTIGEKKRQQYSEKHSPHEGWTAVGEVEVPCAKDLPASQLA